MPTPNEKLAESLEVLEELQKGNRRVFRSEDLSRVHRERLLENGFLQEVMKGWVISSSPDAQPGESTPWHASFWEFCSRYCNERFGDQWHLSPEQSLFLHGDRTVIPDQLVVHSPKATNNDIKLLFGTTLYDLKVAEMPASAALTVRDGLPLFTPAAALVRVPESFFQLYPLEAQVVMASLVDASELLRVLLNGGHSAKAGYLAKAFRQTGRAELADEILRAMRGAGYEVRESSPFEAGQVFTKVSRLGAPPIVGRIEMLWQAMRGKVLANFPKAPGLPKDKGEYLRFVDEIYRTDAYHSLSIEGYSVSPAMVERVRHGDWDPVHDSGDRRNRDALAARGYWQSFQLVKKEVEKVIAGENPAAVARVVHNDWYRELFQPCVAAGLIEPGILAGYRNIPVFLRGSRFVPPRWEAVRDAMPALFDLMEKEPEASVRAVLGHWLFGYIHPYFDGNGRMARFLMNLMLASGGYPWTVIRVIDRKPYLSALDRASIEMDIHPFTTFIVHRVQWRLDPHDLSFPAPMESVVFGRDMVLFYGQDGEAVVRCAITGEALDHHFQGNGKDRLQIFRANRAPIEQEVQRKYLAGDTEVDGSVLIRSDDHLVVPAKSGKPEAKTKKDEQAQGQNVAINLQVDSPAPSREDPEVPASSASSEPEATNEKDEQSQEEKGGANKEKELDAPVLVRPSEDPEVLASSATIEPEATNEKAEQAHEENCGADKEDEELDAPVLVPPGEDLKVQASSGTIEPEAANEKDEQAQGENGGVNINKEGDGKVALPAVVQPEVPSVMDISEAEKTSEKSEQAAGENGGGNSPG